MSSKPKSTSPWASINGMLMFNKCWLCQNTFPRGQTRKSFQLSQLLDCFARRFIAEKNGQQIPPFESEHLRLCYESYHSHLVNGEEGAAVLQEELTKNDMEPWMSGLICQANESCKKEVIYILPELSSVPTTGDSGNQGSAITNHKGMTAFTFASKEDCPPGCGCDNPWPFLS